MHHFFAFIRSFYLAGDEDSFANGQGVLQPAGGLKKYQLSLSAVICHVHDVGAPVPGVRLGDVFGDRYLPGYCCACLCLGNCWGCTTIQDICWQVQQQVCPAFATEFLQLGKQRFGDAFDKMIVFQG